MENLSDVAETSGVKVLASNDLGVEDSSDTVPEQPGDANILLQSMEHLMLDDQPGCSKSIKKVPSRDHENSLVKTGCEGKSFSIGSNLDLELEDAYLSDEYADFENQFQFCGDFAALEMERKIRDRNNVYALAYPYVVLSTEDVMQYMADSIQDANVVLELPTTTVRTALNHFKWDKEGLFEKYFDGDQEKLLADAGVFKPRIPNSLACAPREEEICEVCFMLKPSSMMYGLGCGHRFCIDCWSDYLTTKIMEDGMGQTIACAAFNCPIIVDDATVMTLVTDAEVKIRYQYLITNSFVQCNRLMRWCPSAGCTNVVRVEWVDWRPVTCLCGCTFCFQCGENWHSPLKCFWLKSWLKIYDKSFNWIALNTKECPNCGVVIQRMGGCNHMVCENTSCKAEFCWTCLSPWSVHEHVPYCTGLKYHKSRALKKSPPKRRFLYFSKFRHHSQSLKLMQQHLYPLVEMKMKEMQKHMSWIEVQFLKKAVDVLAQCRQTLIYTYVFSFYLAKSNQSDILEHNLDDLEAVTEILSNYLESETPSGDSFDEFIKQVKDKYTYCEIRRQVLLDHVNEGYEEGWWVANDDLQL